MTSIYVAPSLKGYIIDVVEATRQERDLVLGVSPRGALALQRASRAYAASAGRDYVIPDDLKLLAGSVLEHRLILSPEAQLRGGHRRRTSCSPCWARCRCRACAPAPAD